MNLHEYRNILLEAEISHKAKLVAFTIAQYANVETGQCYPSLPTLEMVTGITRKTIAETIKELVKEGLLRVEKKRLRGTSYKSNVYTIPCVTTTQMSTQVIPQVITQVATTHKQENLDNLDNIKEKNTKKEKLPDWMPLEDWEGYLEIRKANKVKNTDQAIKLLIGKLDRARAKGHDPAEMLQEATINNWKSVYEPKEQNNGNRKQENIARTDWTAGTEGFELINSDSNNA